ncbi:MAG: Ig-like domain-containing protein, partial [Prosthecobacter sp.]
MKVSLQILALVLFGFSSTVQASTWSTTPWTGDASTGIVNGETQWAYHFGSTTSATVNGVSVPGFAAPPVSAANQFDLTGSQFVLTADNNNLTSLGGSSSAILGSSFFYGGLPSTNLTVKAASLQPGVKYVVSLLSVGWDGDQRLIKFVSGTDELAIDQNLYGENFGLRADYAFTAGAGDQVIRVDMNNAFNRTFHIYAVALRKVYPAVLLTSSTNPASQGTNITFTAAVSGPPGGATPTGTVEFKNGGTTIGSGTLNGSGVATFSTSALATGTYSITASYLGGGSLGPAESNTVSQSVTGIFTVTSAANSGAGSLAETITAASSGSLIIFDTTLAGQTVQMPTSEIIVDKDLTIDGAALEGAALQGTSTNRLFYIPVTRTVVFKNLTLAGGGGVGAANTLRGGAVLNAGSFTAMDCVFRDNKASLAAGVASGYSTQNTSLTVQRCLFSGNAVTNGFGGALMNLCLNGITSTALVEDSAFISNSATGGGGAIYNSGNNGTANMTLRQCTITGNSASSTEGGGGVLNYATVATGTANLTVTHCTIVKNTSLRSGGGVSQLSITGGTASITLTSNIIAENTAALGPDVRLTQGTVTSQGTNLIGNATDSGITWLGSDLTGTSGVPLEARVASVGYYGGPTPTCPPLSGSPALDAAPTPAFSTDQRGLPRVVDADGISGALADIGAVESKFVQVDVATDELETPAGVGDVSLREALRDAPVGAIITFAPGLSGQTLTLDGVLGELVLTKDVTVDAASLPAGFGIGLGTGNHLLVNVNFANASVNLRNLRFTGGAGAA